MNLTKEDLLAISSLLEDKLKPVNQRLDKIETRIAKLETRIAKLETRIDQLENRIQKLEARMDHSGTYMIDMETRFDQKLQAEILPLKNQLTRIEVDLLENNILPRLNTIETCYVSTYNRYKDTTERMDAIILDVDVLKTTVSEHSKLLQAL